MQSRRRQGKAIWLGRVRKGMIYGRTGHGKPWVNGWQGKPEGRKGRQETVRFDKRGKDWGR